MPKLETLCPECGNDAVTVSEYKTPESFVTNLDCGHTIVRPITDVDKSAYENIVSLTGKKPFPFQVETALQAERAGLRYACLHEMGLGKTVIDLIVHKMHPELFPWMILCKSALKYQWFHEVIEWLGPEYAPQIIDNSKEKPYPEVFKVIIVSLDLIRNCPWRLEENSIKSITIDECQLIKNHNSKRTNAARAICEDKDYVSLLSGTPIHNHALEYFPGLNIVRPEIFPTQMGYVRDHCDVYGTGYSGAKVGGLRNPDRFHALTESFIFRKTRKEVMPDLPEKFYTMKYDLLGDWVKDEYNAALTEFSDEMDKSEGKVTVANYGNILGFLSRMRHITGKSKIEMTSDFVMDFMKYTDEDRKLVVFYHHQDVGNILFQRLSNLLADEGMNPPLQLTADNPDKRAEFARTAAEVHWVSKDPKDRLLLASTLVAGEGLNLQACYDGVIMERQWTPVKEVQAEDRFVRIGSVANQVNITYMLAIETIDEWITKLIEKKRSVLKSVLDNEESYDEAGMVRQIAELLYSQGKKGWSYR